jgi:hypothetical protein
MQHVAGRLFYPCKPGVRAPGTGAGQPKRGLPWISQLPEATGRLADAVCHMVQDLGCWRCCAVLQTQRELSVLPWLPGVALSGGTQRQPPTRVRRLRELPVLSVESVVGAAGEAAAALRAVGRGRHAAPPACPGMYLVPNGCAAAKSSTATLCLFCQEMAEVHHLQ